MKLLYLKHWQLFVLIVGIPVIIRILSTTALKNQPRVINSLFPFVLFFMMGIYFGWSYYTGTSLSKKIPDSAKMSVRRFKIMQLFPIIYIPIFGITTYLLVNFSSEGKPNQGIIAILGLLLWVTLFACLYCIYYNSKSIKAVELQRAVTIKDYFAEFLLILFFPIGLWVIQPRLNAIFKSMSN